MIPNCGWSQKMDCEQTIAHATDEFNAGHFYSIPVILNECLKSFSREQRQRAFLLLTQTYLLLDDPIGAQKSFLEILSANPEFIADEQLHAIDIVYLSKRFTAAPKFSWFVKAGSNVSPVRVILDIDVGQDERKQLKEYYRIRAGYQVGLGGEYSYDDHIKIRIESDYLHTAYSSTVNYFERDTKTFIDRQSWISIPFYVSYAGNIGKYRPYGYAGYSFSWLFNDRGSIDLKNVNFTGEQTEIFEAQSADFNLLERRNKLNQSLIFGGGVKYKIGLDFIFAELRYSAGLKNIVNPDGLYGNYVFDPVSGQFVESFDPTGRYAHVDDYFRLDNISISFGFLRPLYKPRELKRPRTKGVLRKMKRSK
jgi:opacity protein-like surface antigen